MEFWYKKRILAVLLLSSEIVSFVLDKIGGSNRLFLVASFLLSAIGFVTTIYTSFFSSTVPAVARSESERQLIAVEIVFSFIQLVFTFIQLIRIFLGAKSNNNESLLPLAFAVISVVFSFRNNEEAQVGSDSASVSQIISPETPAVDDESAIMPLSSTLRQRTTSTQSNNNIKVKLGQISEDDLKQYDGSDTEKPLLMAIKGQIYDVSKSRMFYGPGGPYALFAGKDASRALAKMTFEDEDLTGDISGLGPFELDALLDWEYKFMSRYDKVGSIKKDVPETKEKLSGFGKLRIILGI